MTIITTRRPGRWRPQIKAAGVGWYRTRDLDPVAVLRAVDGDHLKLTKAERDTAIDRLDRQGLSAKEIAERIGCAERTVTRRRTQRQSDGGPAPKVSEVARRARSLWERIDELDAAGIGAVAIAARLGVSRKTIYNCRSRRAAEARQAAA